MNIELTLDSVFKPNFHVGDAYFNKSKLPTVLCGLGYTSVLGSIFKMLCAVGFLLVVSAQTRAEVDNLITKPPQASELACLLFPEANDACANNEANIVNPERAIAGVRQGKSSTVEKRAKHKESAGPRTARMAIQFKFGSSEIEPVSRPFIDTIAKMLIMPEMQQSAIFIEGHTDAVGDAGANKRLSLQRALAIKQYLIAQYQIDPDRLHVTGKGESDPLTPVDPNAAVNRRVEIKPL